MSMSEIKSMALYYIDWIINEVEELKKLKNQPTVKDFNEVDQFHYYGVEALEHTAQIIDITSKTNLLDIGSGLGGPARYLAWKYGCEVTGVELQKELCDIAIGLTAETALSEKVSFINKDILEHDFQEIEYDAWVSYLVFLHIKDRTNLFKICASGLKNEGRFYIEDYYQKHPFSYQEKESLDQVVACPYLPDKAQYIEDLENAGFKDIQFEDVTDKWSHFVKNRVLRFDENKNRHTNIHGPELTNHLETFYQTVSNLFQGGNLGGVKISGRKP